ncbi:MAG: hypothetical protein IPM82_24515 [Saprospiraceae bacterium]|nr:hypothetical protein [Saprospiraceae bacterium]
MTVAWACFQLGWFVRSEAFGGGLPLCVFSRYKSGRACGNGSRAVDNELGQISIGNPEPKRSVSERWYGAVMAYRLTDNPSIGASQFFTFPRKAPPSNPERNR